jgi:hypothetical protein
VSCLLTLALRSYSRNDLAAAGKSLEFENEARMLWRADGDNNLPNLVGLTLLYIAVADNRNGGLWC